MYSLKAVLAIAAIASSLPLTSAVVFDKIARLPKGWNYARTADASEIVKLRVAVKQQNVDVLEQMVYDMSTPGHASYGQHLSGQEVLDIVRPKAEADSTVLNWLRSSNVSAIYDDGNWIAFLTDVRTANEMLDTKFSWFVNEITGKETLRTMQYSVPEQISQHIDFVQPTTKFSNIKALGSSIHKGDDASKAQVMSVHAEYVSQLLPGLGSGSTIAPPDAVCNTVITPQCLLKLYNVHYAANPQNGAKISFGSFLTQYARYTDLTLFEATQAMYAQGQSFNVVEFNGGLNDQTGTEDATEANLDCQYLTGVGYPVPLTEFSTAGLGPQIDDPNETTPGDNEPYVEFLAGILALPDSALPQTLSISYGEDEQSWPIDMAKSVCNGFMQLGARGVSVMFSSGDSGPGAICENVDGSKVEFVPAFPVSCPFVTGVGATQGAPIESGADFSGGGFSNYFAQPAYQKRAVEIYLANNPNFRQYYNASGRGYPDVSAQGVNFLVVEMGLTEPVDGTSASSPTFSSIIGLLNSARIESEQKPLGFLNPFLYSTGFTALNDITAGGSTGCSNGPAGASFNATCGWDPATGLGTPDFGKLLALVAPQECNTGGPLANPTSTACDTAANSALSSSLVAHKTYCPVTVTTSSTATTSKMSTSSTTSPTSKPASINTSTTSTKSTTTTTPLDCHSDNCLRELQDSRFSSMASAFCSTYTTTVDTKTSEIPTYWENCSGSPSAVSSACSCLVAATTTSSTFKTSTTKA